MAYAYVIKQNKLFPPVGLYLLHKIANNSSFLHKPWVDDFISQAMQRIIFFEGGGIFWNIWKLWMKKIAIGKQELEDPHPPYSFKSKRISKRFFAIL